MSVEPQLSFVLVTDTYETIRSVVRALAAQTAADALEVVLVGPAAAPLRVDGDDVAGFAAHRVVAVESILPLARARAEGVRATTAPLVNVGETHAFQHPGFAAATHRRLRRPVDGGGARVRQRQPRQRRQLGELPPGLQPLEPRPAGRRDRLPAGVQHHLHPRLPRRPRRRARPGLRGLPRHRRGPARRRPPCPVRAGGPHRPRQCLAAPLLDQGALPARPQPGGDPVVVLDAPAPRRLRPRLAAHPGGAVGATPARARRRAPPAPPAGVDRAGHAGRAGAQGGGRGDGVRRRRDRRVTTSGRRSTRCTSCSYTHAGSRAPAREPARREQAEHRASAR